MKTRIEKEIAAAKAGMTWSARFVSPGSLVHAVPNASDPHRRALCNVRPAYSSAGWQSPTGADVTCPRCLRAVGDAAASELAEMSRANARLIAENAELRRRLELPNAVDPRPAERRREETRLRAAAPLRGRKPQTDCNIGLFAPPDLLTSK